MEAVQAKRNALGKDVNINKYVAGGIAVFDLGTRMLKWHTHLDLSTDETNYRAHIYSAPSVADLDGDGSLEIIVGTSMVCSLVCLPACLPVSASFHLFVYDFRSYGLSTTPYAPRSVCSGWQNSRAMTMRM